MATSFLLLAGTHSGCGKTTLTAGLLRAFRNRGITAAPFKVGPDYLDPRLHEAAAGRPCWNLDGWFQHDASLCESLGGGSQGADLGLIEGVMGLFDGSGNMDFEGSTAELAVRLDLPVVLIVDGSGVGGSIAATVLGHRQLWPRLGLVGVILNRLGSEGHFELQRAAIEAHTDVPVLGWARASKAWHLPERHLGIHQPHELKMLDSALDALALELASTLDLDRLAGLAQSLHLTVAKMPEVGTLPVAIAQDEAFSFIYADTLDRLERLGVRWIPFSPLRDRLPEGIAGVYLPGGYPELHAEALSANTALHADLREAHRRGMPILAECGGYLFLAEALRDLSGRTHPMVGLVPGTAHLTDRLQSFGYKELEACTDNLLCARGERGKAHEFHHAVLEGPRSHPAWNTRSLRGEGELEGFAQGNLLAAFAHIPFSAQPAWAERWVEGMRNWFNA